MTLPAFQTAETEHGLPFNLAAEQSLLGSLLFEPVGLLDLTGTSCRYPVSGEGAETLFCGYPTEATYCHGHVRLCWTGIPERKTPTTPLPKGMAA